jgi:hypothetical protein
VRVRGSSTLQVGRPDDQRAYVVHVEGFAELAGTHVARVSSDKEVLFVCGKSSIRMTPEQIELVAPTLRLSGEGATVVLSNSDARIAATGDAALSATKVALRADGGASLGLDSEARLGGDKVRLGAKDGVNALTSAQPPPPTRIELKDQDGNPLAHRRFTLLLPDGSTRAGLLDGTGAAVVDVDQPVDVVFEAVQAVKPA